MSLWIITSSSDPVTIKTDDFKLVAFFTCLLGNGLFSAKEWTDGTARIVPFFPDDRFDPWFVEQFGAGYEISARSVDKAELAAVFDSVILGAPEDRVTAEEEIEKVFDPKGRKIAQRRINKSRAVAGWQICDEAEQWANRLRVDAARERKRSGSIH